MSRVFSPAGSIFLALVCGLILLGTAATAQARRPLGPVKCDPEPSSGKVTCSGDRQLVHEMTWKLSSEGFCDAPGVVRKGEKEITLEFVRFPEHSMVICSSDLAGYLGSKAKQPVQVTFIHSRGSGGHCTCRIQDWRWDSRKVTRSLTRRKGQGKGKTPWD